MPQTKEEHIQDQNGSDDSDSDSSSDSSSDHGSVSSSRHSIKSERHRRHSATAPAPPNVPSVQDHIKVSAVTYLQDVSRKGKSSSVVVTEHWAQS